MALELELKAWMATSRQVLPKQTYVTAITATNELILLGTRSGRILRYNLEFGLLRSGHFLSDGGKCQGPVTQLATLDTVNAILALCEGVIHVFSLSTMSRIGIVPVHENGIAVTSVVKFITRPIFGSVEVIAATRRQLIFSEYDADNKVFRATRKALFVPSAPASLCWICGKLCLGFEREFTLVDVDSGFVESLWFFESGPAFCVSVNSAHTILSCKKNGISFSVRPEGIVVHSRVNWGDCRRPVAFCVQDGLLFVSFSDHIGVFTVDDVSHPVGRIDLVNIFILLATSDAIVAGNSEAIFILRRMSKEVLQRDVVFLDKVAKSNVTQRELHMQNFFNNSLDLDSKHPYAQSIDAFIKSQPELTVQDSVPFCRRIRMFIDAFVACILDDFLANEIELNQRQQYLVTLWISVAFFSDSLFDSIFRCFKSECSEEDKKLAEAYLKLQDLTLTQLGSSMKIIDPVTFFGSAITLLRSLPDLRSPFAMFDLLSESLSSDIYKTIHAAGDSCGVTELTADEYIPILVYIVIQSGVQHLHAHISFMSAFISVAESRGHIGYVLTTISVCLEHIRNLAAGDQIGDSPIRTLSHDVVETVLQERASIIQNEQTPDTA